MIRMIDGPEVRERLTYERCIPIMREAMIALSEGVTRQLLRAIIPLADGRAFGVMPGALGERELFGAKLVSVWPENFSLGKPSHQGLIILFDGETGAPVCLVDATEVTAIRTAAASAVATDALARPEASSLALVGYGEQALSHARAISRVRNLSRIRVWGRDAGRREAFASLLARDLNCDVASAPSAEDAVTDADIVCTITSAREPILKGAWLKPGAHLNLVGSSYAGPSEVDHQVVVMSRFIADHRLSVLSQGAEFLHAKAAGRVGDDHVVGEIGEVLAGRLIGRRSPDEVTVYKSLGHIVQDLAAAAALYRSTA